MKARLIKSANNGRNYSETKEVVSIYNVIAIHKGEIKNPITFWFYMDRGASASVVYASVWYSSANGEIYGSGSGTASGHGYYKESAAADSAISSA